jgi:putative membrane protein
MEWEAILKGVPIFLQYLALGFGLLVAFFVIYVWVTPHDELKLIRGGNSAAALSLGGAMLGFVLPLGIVIAHHATVPQVAFWGVIALVVQIVAFFIARALVPALPQAIESGKNSAGALAGLVSLVIGILNAACQIE